MAVDAAVSGNNNCLFLILILLCAADVAAGALITDAGGNNCDCLIWILLLCCAVVAVALAADKHPPISSISFENASMYILIPQI